MGNGWRKWTAALAACLMLVVSSGCYAEVWQGTSLTGENGGYSLENELYGEAIHLEYEIGGFEANRGQVNTKRRARPVDKALFVRKGMRITGGGAYQVQVVAVDSAGAAGEYLCFYAEEYKGTATSRENRKEHSGLGEKCGTESKGRIQGNLSLHQAS